MDFCFPVKLKCFAPMYFSRYKASIEFKVTFAFCNVFLKRIKQPPKWKKFWFQIELNQIVLVKPSTYFLFCLAIEMGLSHNALLLWVSLPTPCSCSILTCLYHLCHYFTPFRQILVAGIGSEMEIRGCHQPRLKWLSFNGLCEIGGWIQVSFCTCPRCKLVGFVFPKLCGPGAVALFSLRAEEGDEASLWLL